MTATARPSTGPHAASHELTLFFAVAFAASWLVGGVGFLVLDLGLAGLAMGTAALAASAFLLTYRRTGSIRPLLRDVLRWRVGSAWYLAALGVPFLAVGATLLIAPQIGGSGLPADALGLGAVLLFLPVQVMIGGLEEPGWRGYALPRLQRRMNALPATLLLAGVWMLWHAPLFLVPNPIFTETPIGPYVVVGFASSVVYTWVYNSTGGSVLLVMLLHGAKNSTLVWLGSGLLTWSIFAGAWVLAAAVVVAVHGPEHLARRSRHTGDLTVRPLVATTT